MGDGTEKTCKWLPAELSEQDREHAKHVAMFLDYDIEAAGAFCVALLEEVNLHKEAEAVNELLVSLLTP